MVEPSFSFHSGNDDDAGGEPAPLRFTYDAAAGSEESVNDEYDDHKVSGSEGNQVWWQYTQSDAVSAPGSSSSASNQHSSTATSIVYVPKTSSASAQGQEDVGELRKSLGKAEHHISLLQNRVKTQNQALEEQKQALDALRETIESLNYQILYGDSIKDQEIERLTQELATTKQERDLARRSIGDKAAKSPAPVRKVIGLWERRVKQTLAMRKSISTYSADDMSASPANGGDGTSPPPTGPSSVPSLVGSGGVSGVSSGGSGSANSSGHGNANANGANATSTNVNKSHSTDSIENYAKSLFPSSVSASLSVSPGMKNDFSSMAGRANTLPSPPRFPSPGSTRSAMTASPNRGPVPIPMDIQSLPKTAMAPVEGVSQGQPSNQQLPQQQQQQQQHQQPHHGHGRHSHSHSHAPYQPHTQSSSSTTSSSSSSISSSPSISNAVQHHASVSSNFPSSHFLLHHPSPSTSSSTSTSTLPVSPLPKSISSFALSTTAPSSSSKDNSPRAAAGVATTTTTTSVTTGAGGGGGGGKLSRSATEYRVRVPPFSSTAPSGSGFPSITSGSGQFNQGGNQGGNNGNSPAMPGPVSSGGSNLNTNNQPSSSSSSSSLSSSLNQVGGSGGGGHHTSTSFAPLTSSSSPCLPTSASAGSISTNRTGPRLHGSVSANSNSSLPRRPPPSRPPPPPDMPSPPLPPSIGAPPGSASPPK